MADLSRPLRRGMNDGAAAFHNIVNLPLTGEFDTARLPVIAAEPVTVTVARRVLPGWEGAFLTWADEVLAAVRQAPGCLGAAVFAPGEAGGEYQIVVRFANGVLLREWERSAVRNELMDRSEQFVTGARLRRTVGVEAWFEAAGNAQPQRVWWKRLMIDLAWVYPVSLMVALFVLPWFASLPFAARVLLSAAMITLTLQLFVSPLRGRLRAKRRL